MPELDLDVEHVECIEDALGFVLGLSNIAGIDEKSQDLIEETQKLIANQMKDYE